jgi:anti-sigma-K factor RskA
MRDAHDELAALAPAYALDALDGAEREVFETHLSHCVSCMDAVRAFHRVTSEIGGSVPLASPSPAARRRVLAAVASSSTVGSPALTPRTPLAAWLAIAALLAVAIGLGVYAGSLRTTVADLRARLDEAMAGRLASIRELAESRRVAFQMQNALDVLVAPDLARIDLAGQATAPSARARALWSRQRGMVFAASNLPPLPPGRTYQVWVVTAHDKVSAGVIAPDENGRVNSVFATPPDIETPAAVAVTLEPAGGVPQPTGPFYLLGTPQS